MDDEQIVNPRLLAASLFTIAYGIDVIHYETKALLELYRFCALALAEYGLVNDTSFPQFANSNGEHEAAVSRTQFLMGAVERDAEYLAATEGGEIGMLALQLSAVFKLQHFLTESDRRLVMEIIDSQTSPPRASIVN